MKIISVVPISKSVPKDVLYYFTADQAEVGDLIEVPLRNRVVVAKIEKVEDVVSAKAELKNLPFAIRRAVKLKRKDFFSPAFMAAAEKTAKFFGSTLGAALHALLPPKKQIEAVSLKSQLELATKPERPFDGRIIQAPAKERYATLRGLIRGEFAKNKSVFVTCPTIASAIILSAVIKKGIENYTFLFHQRLSKQKIAENIKNINEFSHPILIVATPQFLGLVGGNFGMIIIEEEGSRYYKKEGTPSVDFRVFANYLADGLKVKIVHSDLLLRAETIKKFWDGILTEESAPSFRLKPRAEIKLSANIENLIPKKKADFSDGFMELVSSEKYAGDRLFVLVPRRGLFPRTYCKDCGAGFNCENCGAFMFLHQRGSKRLFFCHRCGSEETAVGAKCRVCSSWNLKTFGLGSAQVENLITSFAPKRKVFRVDKDTAANELAVEKTMNNFLSTPGGILVGTEMALNLIAEPVENLIVLSPEMLSTVPEYRSDENSLRVLSAASEAVSKTLYLETAGKNCRPLKHFLSGNLYDFYREELELRKALNFPPFSQMIVISWPNKPDDKDDKVIEGTFKDYDPTILDSFESKRAIIRLKPENWPDDGLREKLLSLPVYFRIEVDPERLL